MKPELSDREFERVRAILEQSAGLVHDESRRDALASTVHARVRACGVGSASAYLDLLAAADGDEEIANLIDAVTIQETHFFRNPPQIRSLRLQVLPELIRRSVAADRRLTIWSAGCSTGEEAYTLAMLVRELLPMATSEHVRIVGSDVSATALRFAAAARYGARSMQMAEPIDLARWFKADGDSYLVRDDVRELVELRRHNLITERPPFAPGEVNLLLCRNVTIYFNRVTTQALMGRFHTVLSDGGYLFLGHSETLWQMSDAFTLVPLGDAFVYRRDAEGERRAILPERRTESGDAPVLIDERRTRKERRGRAAQHTAAHQQTAPPPGGRKSGPAEVVLPPGQPLPPMTTQRGQPPIRRPGRGAPSHPRSTPAARAVEATEAARAALVAGRYADAVAAAAAAAGADPLLVDPHLISGEALVNLGRDAFAVRELRQAVYLQPDCGPAHLLLAGALDRLGERAAAGRAYRAAAATIAELPADKVGSFFGGRDAAELVALCITLADQAERAARSDGAAGKDGATGKDGAAGKDGATGKDSPGGPLR